MTDIEFWQLAYSEGWATKEQVAEAVTLGQITPEQYEQTTGESYVAA